MTGPVFRNTWSTLRARETFGLGVEEVDEWEEGGVDDCEDLGEKGEDHQLESRVNEEGTYDVEFVADILKRWRSFPQRRNCGKVKNATSGGGGS